MNDIRAQYDALREEHGLGPHDAATERDLRLLDIDVDGRPWRTCGWSGAISRLRRSCVRLARRAG